MIKKYFFNTMLSSLFWGAMTTAVMQADEQPITVRGERYTLEAHEPGFRFAFTDADGSRLAPAHADAGLLLEGERVDEVKLAREHENIFEVRTSGGRKARVQVDIRNHVATLSVHPRNNDKRSRVTLRLGGMPVAYGLGDHGGYSDSLNLVGKERVEYSLQHNGGKRRWLSSFVIFPRNRLAGVVFNGDHKMVALGPDEYAMTIETRESVKFHYILGDMKSIYRSYLELLQEKGYPNIKPKFRLFELGWESWAALGWNTNADTVLESISEFQEAGYPIRWAVTGSGFWEEGGTTTSFGKFGENFSNPKAFKQRLHERNVAWMIGLRTNFVPPADDSFYPETDRRDYNLEQDEYKGNKLSRIGLEKGYFLTDKNNDPILKTSGVFPTVPCLILDGTKSKAAAWFERLYQKWGVDGIKEDTMMKMGSAHIDIFNDPVARIAEEGDLVMARCGSFSSQGTLLRINDTQGVKNMSKRTPINYLQYAACGEPNVYSDTIGFREMESYSDAIVRHAWMMAMTAGLSVGESPFHWSEKQQELFRNPIDFHYRLAPYMYDAAAKTYLSGFPFTMTPMGIACPEDKQAMETPHFQWMVGESLLAAPLVQNHKSGKMDIYLPAGVWFDYDTGKRYQGPKLLQNFAMPRDKTPAFVGGRGILVLREAEDNPLRAKFYPLERKDPRFTFYYPDGESKSEFLIKTVKSDPSVTEQQSGRVIQYEKDTASGAISFPIEPGKAYRVSL